jgi:hypothetical protein
LSSLDAKPDKAFYLNLAVKHKRNLYKRSERQSGRNEKGDEEMETF